MVSTLLWIVAIWTATSFALVGGWVSLCYAHSALARVKRSGFRPALGLGTSGASRTRVSSHAA